MRLFNTLVGLLAFSFSHTILAHPIESEKLFAKSENELIKISPDGKHVSSYYRGEKTHDLSIVDLKTRQIIASIPLGNDNRLVEYEWLNESQLYLGIQTEKEHVVFIGNISGDILKFQMVAVEGYVVDTMSKVKNKLLFAKVSGRYRNYYDFYIVEIDALLKNDFDEAQKIDRFKMDGSQYTYDQNFNQLIFSELEGEDDEIIVKAMNIDDGEWKTLIKLKYTEYKFKSLQFISKNTLAVLTNKDSDKVVLREFDVEKQSFGKIIYQHPKYDLTSAWFLENGELKSVAYKQHGLTKNLYFDKGDAELFKRFVNTFKNQESYVAGQSDDQQTSLLYINGSTQPGEYFIYDHKKDVLSRLFVSYPELNETKFSQSQSFKIDAKDGMEIEAFLTLPQGIDHSTLLVMPHGGPIGVQESDRFNSEIQYLSSRGFSVLRVNFRGSSGFGKAFSKQGVGEFGQLIEEDITAAVNHITQKYQFENMCSIGASYGGYSATMLAIKHPDKYDCVVAAYGVYDLPLAFNASNYRSGEKYEKHLARTVGEFSESMTDFSPVYISEKLKAPILLIAGRDDDTADFEHSNRFNYVLQQDSHQVETMFYHNVGHGQHTYFGIRNEAALTYDFLMRTLNLKQPQIGELTELGKKAIADDYAYIADGYQFGHESVKDIAKAHIYYQKAARYEHPRAIFNLGAEFHSGELENKSYSKAVEHYRKSADLGYAMSYARLGRMYMEGYHFEKNWQNAFVNLTKANEIDDTPYNRILLGRFHCIAPGEYRNVQRCLELMELEQYKKVSKSVEKSALESIRESLSWIMMEAKLSDAEKNRIKDFAIITLDLTHTNVSLESKRLGLFEFKIGAHYGKDDEFILQSDSTKIVAGTSETDRFGLIFEVDIAGGNHSSDEVAIAMRWTQTSDDGSHESSRATVYYGDPLGEWKILRPYKDIKSKATWRLEIFDLEQNKLFSRDFHVSPESNSEVN